MSELRYCCVVADDAGKVVRDDSGKCPLKSVAVTGLIRDAVAQTTLLQTYVNPLHDAAIEAVYIFPLYEGVAVVGFEAEVDDKKIIGRVQEKAAARKEYESAKKAGKVTSLLEMETPDTFQASVGNIPPAKSVVIRITLVSEIKQDGDENQVRYVMPTDIAPRYGYSPFEESTSSVDSSTAELSVDMGVAMSKAITSIQSPSHTMEVQLGRISSDGDSTPNQARVKLTADALLDRDLVIIVQAEGLDAPRATVERHERDGTNAVALTFAPRFELNASRALELVFIVDRSGSMSGPPVRKAGAALALFLRSIPCEAHCFNIIGFGSSHRALFPKSVPYDADSLQRGARYARDMQADMGGTEMLGAFQETFRLRRGDLPLQIFLLTDGEIWDVESLCSVVRAAVDEGERSDAPVRVFSLGIGDNVSHNLIESVARAGTGYAQLVMESERMEKKVLNMLKSALIPPVTDLHVKWTPKPPTFDEEFVLVDAHNEENSPAPSNPSTPVNLFSTSPEVPSPPPPPPVTPSPHVIIPIHQAPFKIPILSRGTRFTIYAILSPNVDVPSEVILEGTSRDGPVELKVAVMPVQDDSMMLHALAARAMIRDLEEGASCVHALRRDRTATQSETLKSLGVHTTEPSQALSSTHVDEIAKAQILEMALRHKLSSKHTSWVAVEEGTEHRVVHDTVEVESISFTSEVVDRHAIYAQCMPRLAKVACYSYDAAAVAPRFWSQRSSGSVSSVAYDESPLEEVPDDPNCLRISECSSREEAKCDSVPSFACYSPKYECVPCSDDGAEDDQSEEVEDDQSEEVEDDQSEEVEDDRSEEVEDDQSEEVADANYFGQTTSEAYDHSVELEGDQTELDSHARLHSIVQLQSFDGLFPLIPEIAAFFSTSVEELSAELATVRNKLSVATLSDAQWESLWATCLAVEFLRKQLAELREEWELVVEKAEKKVGALLRDCAQEMDAIKEAAAVVVATAPQSGPDQGVIEAMAGLEVESSLLEAETSAELVAVETTTGPEVRTPLICLIGIASEPATAPESETSEEIVAVETTTGPEVKTPLPSPIGIAEPGTSEQTTAEVETKTH